MTVITAHYRGRFAPTPSGPLHLGSLSTALASWLAARQAGGEWWLRIDDLDRPRCVAGAEDTILRQLEAHGLLWDGRPVRQTAQEDEYRAALQALDQAGHLYACTCTRAVLAATALAGPDGPIYAGTCRPATRVDGQTSSALRVRIPESSVQWLDGVQGMVCRRFPTEAGDFVLRRADGQMGYHLACVLDERRMGITEVVRGADLMGSTVQQLALMRVLAHTPPAYAHVPVVLASDGRKLSKQNGAAAIETSAAAVHRQLTLSLDALGLPRPASLANAPPATLLEWAIPRWDPRALAGKAAGPALP